MSVYDAYPVIDQTAPDTDQEVICNGATRLIIQISNQAVYITFGRRQVGGAIIYDNRPEPYLPAVGTLRPAGGFDAFKFRARVPAAQLPAGATPAYVTLTPR